MKAKNILNSVVGHTGTLTRLLTLIRSERIPHAFLFVGAKGQGKKKVALGFAQTLLCEKGATLKEACGECSACLSVAKGQNIGLSLLEPEKGVIKIEAARALLRQLSLATWGRARVVIIDDAHLMNPQAANALLKSIEEPPAQTFYILISPSQDSVMKTIRSRTQVVRFRELTQKEKASVMNETPDLEFAKTADQILLSLARRENSAAIADCRERIDGREQGLALMLNWLTRVRDEWHKNTLGLSSEQLAHWSGLILEIEKDLVGHCDVQLTLENGINEMSAVL